MEPRSWKWIQVVVIAVAMAIGLGLALWYQNRPVDDAIPAAVAMPDRKVILHPMHPDVIPDAMPGKSDQGAANPPSAGVGADSTNTALAVPVPSQSSVNSWQHAAVDPMAHLRVAPLSGVAPTNAASPASPASPDSETAPTTETGTIPFTTLPGSPSAPASSAPSTSSVSPFVTTAPPADGASAPSTPIVSPFAGAPPAAPSTTPGR